MKKTFGCILLLSLIPAILLAQKQKLDCRKFRNGLFMTKSEVSGMITISRHGNIQTNTTTNGVKMIFVINWISDCSYTMKPTPETIAKYKIAKNALLTVQITKVGAKSYFQVTSSNLMTRKAGSEVVKIGA